MSRPSPLQRLALLASLACSLALAACGGGGGSGGGMRTNPCSAGARCGGVSLALDAVNAAAATQVYAAGPRLAAVAAPAWQSGGIVSGPPDDLRLYVRSVAATPAGGGALVPLFQSSDPRGEPVVLSSGALDLAAALGADAFQLPAGSYAGLVLEVSRVADARGCVSGSFRPTAPVTGLVSEVNPAWAASAPLHAGNTYSNDPIADGQVHTFCTRGGANEVTVGTFTTDAVGSNADFEAQETPQWTELDLALDNAGDLGAEARRAASVTVESPASFAVAEGGASTLTLAVDLDRMLRYFANTREDLGAPNPNMKAGTSYFFTTVFPFSTVLVEGDAGSIEGYQLTVVAEKSGGEEVVPGWLTVIRDAGGAVVGGVVIGDDDNGLTVAKGSLDPVAADSGDGTWDLIYRLGAGGDGQAFSGLLDGFAFTAVGGSGSCPVVLTGASWLSGFTGFTAYYTRQL